MIDRPPPQAEALNYHKYFLIKEVPSQIVPNAMAQRWRFFCPACRTERDQLPPNVNLSCTGCDLRWHTDGFRLFVWREAPARVA
jgi:hypothetical protein